MDADFTVGFSKETCEGTISVYSCNGYAILSFTTLEAKCVALSRAMRNSVPFQAQMESMNKMLWANITIPVVCSTVFEDINGALEWTKASRLQTQNQTNCYQVSSFLAIT